MRKTGFYGWKLLAILWVILIITSGCPMYGSSVINAYMAASLHVDRSALGFAYALFCFMMAVPAPLAAMAINRKGVRLTLVLGSVLVAGGGLALATVVHNAVEWYIFFGIVIGLGTLAGGPLTVQAGIARWFVKRKAFAISLLLTGGPTAGLISPPLLNWIIEWFHGNWRMAWWVISAGGVIAALLGVSFVKEWPANVGQFPDGASRAEIESAASSAAAQGVGYQTEQEWTFSEVWRTLTFWLLFVVSLVYSVGFSVYMAHGNVHLRDLGHTPAEAAFSMTIMTFAMLGGYLLVAGIGDRIELRLILAAAMLMLCGAMVLLLHARGAVGLYAYAILLGGGFGMSFPCMMTLAAKYYGEKAFPSLLGFLLSVGPILGAGAAVGAGYIYDRFGSYAGAFYGVSALSLLAFFLVLSMKPPTRPLRQAQGAAMAAQS
jgi:MFS family permease